MKRLECNDLFEGCGAVVEAESDEEILAQAAQHASKDHGVEVTPELAEQVKSCIRSVETATT